VVQQQGFWAALFGGVLDIYRLNLAPSSKRAETPHE
jgi:hypothetical protein